MAMANRMTQAQSERPAPSFSRHGGRLDAAMHAFPHAPQPWIDLSTGINPVAWSPREPLTADLGPLPQASALAELEAAAARYVGADPARVAAVPGSEIALRLLPALGLSRPIVSIRPAYGTHTEVAAEQVAVAALDGVAGNAATILLANPNNPDGRVIDPARLRRIAVAQREAGGWLVVDEAFADAAPADSILGDPDDDLPVIVLRSFGKFFGLAGLRLGFVVAPPGVLRRLRALLGDWPVTAQAIAWGTAAYGDDRWIAATRQSLAERATRLDAVLGRHGLHAVGDSPLFRLVEHRDAAAIFERLARAGILTRPFRDRPDWLRLGLPDGEAAFDRLDRALGRG